MEKTGLINDLDQLLIFEKSAIEKKRNSELQKLCDLPRNIIVPVLREIRKASDIGLILEAEERFLLNDRPIILIALHRLQV